MGAQHLASHPGSPNWGAWGDLDPLPPPQAASLALCEERMDWGAVHGCMGGFSAWSTRCLTQSREGAQ